MNNKLLIKLYVPEFEMSYDIFIPANELVWKVKKLILKSISDLSSLNLDIDDKYVLINKDDGTVYNDNDLVIRTNIKNASELILLSSK
jgi:hypothetical protein